MKKRIFFFIAISIAISFLVFREINTCNFSSFGQLKYSIKIFGINPFINCTGTISTYLIVGKNKIIKFIDYISFKSNYKVDANNPNNLRTGQKIYSDYCAACHASGSNRAPRFGDTAEWEKISAKGIDNLVNSTKNGLNGMPPMGLCNDCNDKELKLAIEYLVNGITSIDNDSSPFLEKFSIESPVIFPGEKIEYLQEYHKKTNEWHRSHGNNQNTKFHRTNVSSNDREAELKLKWKYDFFDIEKQDKFYQENIEVNPVFYKGSLFVLGPDHRFISFDGASGKINWELMLPPVIGMAPRRGILVEKDKVFLNIGARLFAFDYQTGLSSDGFGSNGVFSGGSPTAPFIFKNSVYIVSLDGYIRGFDVHSGELVSEISYRNNNFPGYSAIPWGGVAIDEKIGYVFFSTGNPKPDIVGVSRPGSNQGANTLFAVNLLDGNIAWTFQAIQHDVWDLDLPSPPILVNIPTNNDKELRLVISITKAGNTLIFDRLTGKNLHDIEWVNVNTNTDIPGEALSPVQLKLKLPERLSKIEYSKDDYLQGSPKDILEIQSFIEESNLGYFPPHTIGKASIIYGVHGGGEWTGSSFNEVTGNIFTPINQIPFKIRIQGKTNKKFSSLPKDFQKKWAVEYKQYIKNCSHLHGPERQGKTIKVGEKEVSFTHSLVGLSLSKNAYNLLDKAPCLNQGSEGRNTKSIKNIVKFHNAWDKALNASNSIWFQGDWSRFITKDDSIATDLPDGKIVSSNPLTGRINWQTPIGETKIYNSIKKGKSMFGGVASTDDGLLYVTGSDDNKLYILDQSSGAILYSKQLIAAGSTPPTIFTVNKKTNIAVLATGGIFHNFKNKGASLYIFEH